MATYTENLNLKKPASSDFYNIEDHNDNMDVIDEIIGELRTSHKMQTYTSLSDIGLEDSVESIEAIFTAMKNGTELIISSSHNTNLYPVAQATIRFVKVSSIRAYAEAFDFYGNDNKTRKGKWYGLYNSLNGFSGWFKEYNEANRPTANEIGAVDKTGGVMSGNLTIERPTFPQIRGNDTTQNRSWRMEYASDEELIIWNQSKESTSDSMALKMKSEKKGIATILQLIKRIAGVTTTYNIYHEGNKPTHDDLGFAPIDNQRTDIPENSNLNDATFRTVGSWRCTTTSKAITLTNCPVTVAFTMDVVSGTGFHNTVMESSGYIIQKITTNTGEKWHRRIYAGSSGVTIGDWIKTHDTSNLNFATVETTLPVPTGSFYYSGQQINFPSGFNKDNCVVVSIGKRQQNSGLWEFADLLKGDTSSALHGGEVSVYLADKINVYGWDLTYDSNDVVTGVKKYTKPVNVKITLMKIS